MCYRSGRVGSTGRTLGAVLGDGLWLIMLFGGFVGYLVGRWTAETGRARFDMRNVWRGRKRYRQS